MRRSPSRTAVTRPGSWTSPGRGCGPSRAASAEHVHAEQLGRRGAGLERREPAGRGGPIAAGRSASRDGVHSPGDAHLVVRRRGQRVEQLGVLAELVGGAGQGRGDTGPELVLEDRQDRGPHPDPGERGVAVVRVVPEVDALDLAGGDRVGPADPQQRTPVAVEGPAHPGQGAAARAAGQPEEHGLGLVVAACARAAPCPRRSGRPSGSARRTAPRARRPRSRARRPRRSPGPTPSRPRPAWPSGRPRAGRAPPSPPGARGRRSPR